MESSQKQKQIFLDYTPAELKESKSWQIVYYVLNPYSEKLERKRVRVKPMKSVTERRKLAKRLVVEINQRLQIGWNPFIENRQTKEFTLLFDALRIYETHILRDFKDDNLRLDTYKTYSSRIKNLKKWLLEQPNASNILSYKFNELMISDFLDYLRYERGVSARTRDNYMTFINTLCNWLVQKKYLPFNSCENFKKINKKHKERIVIPEDVRKLIFKYFKEKNKNYFVLCMVCYYCLVRRTELSKIRVSDINLKNKTLFVAGDNSKNHKSAVVSIPEVLSEMLSEHIKGSKPDDYLFSNNLYASGETNFSPNACTNYWSKMRRDLNIDSRIKWYSLKDTGITDLIRAGVPLISVRDQARHHNIKQTDLYTPKDCLTADHSILNSGVKF